MISWVFSLIMKECTSGIFVTLIWKSAHMYCLTHFPPLLLAQTPKLTTWSWIQASHVGDRHNKFELALLSSSIWSGRMLVQGTQPRHSNGGCGYTDSHLPHYMAVPSRHCSGLLGKGLLQREQVCLSSWLQSFRDWESIEFGSWRQPIMLGPGGWWCWQN